MGIRRLRRNRLRWNRQSRYPNGIFGLHVEPRAGGYQERDPRHALQNLCKEIGARYQLFEVVQQERGFFLAQLLQQLVTRCGAPLQGEGERCRDRGGYAVLQRIWFGVCFGLQTGQRNEPCAVSETSRSLLDSSQRQTRFTHAAHAHQRYQAVGRIAQAPDKLRQLILTPKERRNLLRHVVQGGIGRQLRSLQEPLVELGRLCFRLDAQLGGGGGCGRLRIVPWPRCVGRYRPAVASSGDGQARARVPAVASARRSPGLLCIFTHMRVMARQFVQCLDDLYMAATLFGGQPRFIFWAII